MAGRKLVTVEKWVGPVGLLTACLLLASCDARSKKAVAQSHGAATGGQTEVAAGSSSAQKPAPVENTSSVVLDDGASSDAPGALTDGLRVVVLSSKSAKLVWTTPRFSDSEVNWGKTAQLEATAILDPELTLNHVVLLTGLEPMRTYYAQAISRTSSGETTESDVLSFQPFEVESLVVRKTHPRLFFNSDDLPELKKRISTTHAKSWSDLKRNCESGLAKGTSDIAEGGSTAVYARAFAFAGLIGDDSRFRKKAEAVGLACARLGGSGDKMDVRLRALAVSAVYDWLFGYLSDDSKATMRTGMLDMYTRLEDDSGDNEYMWGHSHGNHKPMLLIALALYGESKDATSALDRVVAEYRDGFFATWRNYGDDGGSLKGWWYTSWTLDMEVEVLAALRSGTNCDWYQRETWYEKLTDWYIDGIRSDDHFIKCGDTRMNAGMTQLEWIYALSVVHHFKNPRAKWLAEKVQSAYNVWDLYNFFDILWNDPDVRAQAPSGSLARLHRAAGQVILRDGWGSSSVVGQFRSAEDYTLGHTHLDNNSFTLFYKGGLAVDSGLYDDFGSSHHLNYAKRTIAHNSVLVFDPDEKFTLYGDGYSNDGGQRWLTSADGIPSSFPARAEEVLDPRNGFRAGGIRLFEDAKDYVYAVGDAAPSYSEKKLSVFDRHFLWLKTTMGKDKPVIVVFDEVVSPRTLKKTYLLHTQNRPTVNGRLVSTVNQGGILFQETLVPESPKIEVIGGAGKEFYVNGKNYPSSREPAEWDDAGAYRVEVSSPAPALSERFLHVLHATDAGVGTPPRSARLVGTTMQGCTVEDWAVLFGEKNAGVGSVAYSVTKGAWKHLVLGLIPNATYELKVDGSVDARLPASEKGTLRFDLQGPAKVELARVEASAPAQPAAPPPPPAPAPAPAPAPDPTPIAGAPPPPAPPAPEPPPADTPVAAAPPPPPAPAPAPAPAPDPTPVADAPPPPPPPPPAGVPPEGSGEAAPEPPVAVCPTEPEDESVLILRRILARR